jgi:hypothetical protein
MNSLSIIDYKIQELKRKKQVALQKMAGAFLKQANKTLGQDFSPELALTILHETWTKASIQQKQEWAQRAQKFQQSKSSKSQKKNS